MKITRLTSQYRRDFRADVECEGCGDKDAIKGYDDRNYHDNVIPKMICKKCGESRNSLGIKSDPTPTLYGDNEVI